MSGLIAPQTTHASDDGAARIGRGLKRGATDGAGDARRGDFRRTLEAQGPREASTPPKDTARTSNDAASAGAPRPQEPRDEPQRPETESRSAAPSDTRVCADTTTATAAQPPTGDDGSRESTGGRDDRGIALLLGLADAPSTDAAAGDVAQAGSADTPADAAADVATNLALTACTPAATVALPIPMEAVMRKSAASCLSTGLTAAATALPGQVASATRGGTQKLQGAAGAGSESVAAVVDTLLAAGLESTDGDPSAAASTSSDAAGPSSAAPAGGPVADLLGAYRALGSDAPDRGNATVPLRHAVGSAPWRDELAGRIGWLIDRGDQRATLSLTPEHLGPMEVRIAIREGEASVWFGAAQADTRAAIEQALPRLREMLAASGLSLAHAGVFSDSSRDPQRSLTDVGLARASLEGGQSEAPPAVAPLRSVQGLLDLYA